ncbi:efflux RND transporter periplasmic adaptor subunit [Desulfonatronum thioautotrophicum]|uniref:efflux RND transporter periplasmic adaptor subunit n=1 Tax=Desulfonatronum thioautotrophicum TaxID=617001 RepID=UPI0005EBE172|nr:efflux RND transporter periplasmic adaptor subunit [Desulfonatronum thioautotrophicum]
MRPSLICSIVIGLTLLAGALALTFRPESVPEPSGPERIAEVHVEPVIAATVARESRFTAVTQPLRQASLSFTVPGRMTARPVEVGDRVQDQQVLATLALQEFENVVAQAEAAVAELTAQSAQAGRDHRRFTHLSADNVVEARQAEQSTVLLEQLQAALAGDKAQRAEALRRRDEALLRAPFPGIVTAVHLEPGEWADPGRRVLELQDDRGVKLEVEVPENMISGLKSGQRVHATLPFAENLRVNGRIAHLARAAGRSGRLFPVVVELEAVPGLVPGMTGEVVFAVESGFSLLVPLSAVINPGGARPSLFVLDLSDKEGGKEDQGRVREVFVGLGGLSAKQVVVSGDLVEGDMVVVHGQTRLADGQVVRVAP